MRQMKDPIPKLIEDLGCDDSGRWLAAAEQLSGLGPKAKAAVTALVQALKDKNKRCMVVISVFSAIGPDAKEALPTLTEVLNKKGEDFLVRRWVGDAIMDIAPEKGIAILADAMRNNDVTGRSAAACTLGYVTSKPDVVVPL